MELNFDNYAREEKDILDEGFSINISSYNEKALSIPLYRDSYKLLDLLIKTTSKCPKIILETMCKHAILYSSKIINKVYNAYKYLDTRKRYLLEILDLHPILFTYIKIIVDNSLLGKENMHRFAILLEQIAQQTNAWKNS